jgi:hypothetical protein
MLPGRRRGRAVVVGRLGSDKSWILLVEDHGQNRRRGRHLLRRYVFRRDAYRDVRHHDGVPHVCRRRRARSGPAEQSSVYGGHRHVALRSRVRRREKVAYVVCVVNRKTTRFGRAVAEQTLVDFAAPLVRIRHEDRSPALTARVKPRTTPRSLRLRS